MTILITTLGQILVLGTTDKFLANYKRRLCSSNRAGQWDILRPGSFGFELFGIRNENLSSIILRTARSASGERDGLYPMALAL